LLVTATAFLLTRPLHAEGLSLQSAPPVVVRTVPVAGATDVDPALAEIGVTFSKTMEDGSWSWSTWGEENFPKGTAEPRYLPDGRTCMLPVKLQPDKFYAIWLNSDKFHGFKDSTERPAVPYLLTFVTGKAEGGGFGGGGGGGTKMTDRLKQIRKAGGVGGGGGPDARLNQEQRGMVEWTDAQFDRFFDARNFKDWSDEERADLEAKALAALAGVHNQEYYQAIGTLAALRSHKAVEPLLTIATDRAENDNRDRWMAVRALGMIGGKQVVPELIPLVYHINANTRWWAQISLVRLTGQNFGNDWQAWGKWWDSQGGKPPFKPEIIRWSGDQAEPDKLAESLVNSDREWLQGIGVKPAVPQSAPKPEASSSGKQ
jgi:RNA polymerase sigma-70 factor (ECF subfamily)